MISEDNPFRSGRVDPRDFDILPEPEAIMSDEKKTPRDDTGEDKSTERKRQERELDEALEDTFPASDPPATTQPKAD